MPFYRRIDGKTHEGRRTVEGLLGLRQALSEQMPRRRVAGTLLLATWNIREFDSGKYGGREDEPLSYMAEIIDRFDLVVVQEVREDLEALKRLMDLLGGWWHHLVTDVTEGRRGNRERTAFLYDSRKVRFGGLAGEVVIPSVERRGQKDLEPAKQLARTPFLVGFGADWFRSQICTTHILYGEDDPEDPERVEEIKALSGFLARRPKEEHAWAKNMILLGDFNVFDTTDATLSAITDAGEERGERPFWVQVRRWGYADGAAYGRCDLRVYVLKEVGPHHHNVEAFGAQNEPRGQGVGVHRGGFYAGVPFPDLAEDLVEERHGLGGAISRRLR